MRLLSLKVLGAMTGATVIAGSAATAWAGDSSLAEFATESETRNLGWRIVNDGVMGGRSKGQFSMTDAGTLRFQGTLSLENNGGFSSLRTEELSLDLSGQAGLAMRVRGDGRTYQLRLGSDARYRGMEVSFQADFPTEKGKWLEVKVPFDQLEGSWRGRSLKDKVFNAKKVRRLGLLLADKKAGPFTLEVDWIRTYGAGSKGSIVEKALADGRFKTLAAALTKAGLVDVLKGEGPFTVFAPTDEAFSKLPKGTVANLLKPENLEQLQAVLKFHVVPGSNNLSAALGAKSVTTVEGNPLAISFSKGRIRINNSTLLNADVTCSNGVIHVIDTVLLPPKPEPSNDLLGVAKKTGSFKTLLTAVEASGLDDALKGEGPFTLLAPTDAAFAALPKGTVENLLKKENLDQLKGILTYHAFAGSISAGDALNAAKAKTLNGQAVKFSVQDGRLKANKASILKTDVICDNGVIHIIDAVLLPSATKTTSKSEKRQKASKPSTMIEAAIEKGVPVFNKGHHKECAQIYQRCLEDLSKSEQVESRTRKGLEMILTRGKGAYNDRDRAWLYRHTLDGVYHVLLSRE